ncbi:MAG: DNA polymerase III subunit delta' [Gammaproteobacteria bacterium]
MPWHETPLSTITSALGEGRLAHGLLLHGMAGLGKRTLARQVAAVCLCANSTACGDCPACHWVAADNHPDYYRIEPEEDKRTISVDQIRALIGKLTLSSLATGRKVALIQPADAMTEGAANALLKTLEEPSGDSVLILVADRLSALPATILSRCQGVAVPRPDTDVGMAWLRSKDSANPHWPGLLRLANGAPLAALALHEDDFGKTIESLSADLRALSSSQANPASIAARWVKANPARCLEWLARRVSDVIRVRFGVAGRDVAHNLRPEDLPDDLNQIKLSRLFDYLDQLRRAQRQLDTSLNAQQLLEAVLVPWALRFRSTPPRRRAT